VSPTKTKEEYLQYMFSASKRVAFPRQNPENDRQNTTWLEVMPMKFVIIGGDATGMSAASRVKRNRPDTEVIVLEKTMDVSYSA